MAHERADIRAAVVAQIVGPLTPTPAYRTSAGARVSKSRQTPARAAELPCISVYTEDETVDAASAASAPRELKRTVQVGVVGWLAASEDLDDALDALALEIETAMDVDLNLDATAFGSYLVSTDILESVEGNRPMGAVRLTYAVTYHTDIRTAVQDAAMDDFETVDIHHDLAGAQAVPDQANDTFTVEE